jgi:RNA ligase
LPTTWTELIDDNAERRSPPARFGEEPEQPMTVLTDLFPREALDKALADRHVVKREHPTLPLAILNYTDTCQYERGLWTDVTRACRGIIYDTTTGEVIARPFRKFFNYGQAEAGEVDLTSRCTVTDKLDGSLGILYPTPDGFAIATRGAFVSDQAQHATALLRERYADVTAPNGYTVLFEIVYPDNRIVCDYGEYDDLILLGAVEITSGHSIGPTHPALRCWPGPRAEVFDYATVADALAAPPRPNAEGLVLHLLDVDERLKIKQEDYVRLHRIVTGLNERTVWEYLCEGKPLADLITPLPDEFHAWVREVADRLTTRVDSEADEIEIDYRLVLRDLPPDFPRKDFALAIKDHPLKWALFSRHDGKDYRPALWKNAKPEAFLTPRGLSFSEDTA